MKTRRLPIRATLGILVAIPFLNSHEGFAQGMYLYGDVGVNFLQDTDLTLDINGLGSATAEVEFDPGLRLNFGAGYRFNESLSVGGETGFIYNSVDTLGGFDVSGYDLNYYQIPFLGVVTYEFHNSSPFTPFVTGGMGFVVGVLEIDDDGYSDSQGSAAFAYQLGAGVDYKISESIALGLTYKFLGTTDQEFEDDSDYSVEMDGAINHMVALIFKVRF